MASFLYQKVKTNFEKRIVVFSSLAIVTIVFLFIAYFRSIYLSNHNVHISPTYFVVFNLFFFIISALLSFFVLPTFNEMKEQYKHIKLYYAVKRRDKEIKKLMDEKDALRTEHHETEKERIQKIYLAKYVIDLIKKMHGESIGTFKGTNHFLRPDRKTPVCFSDTLAEPDIQDITMTVINSDKE